MNFVPQPISKAVCHYKDYVECGCPVCKTGATAGRSLLSTAGCTLFECDHCGVAYLVCADELNNVPSHLPDYGEMTIPSHPFNSRGTTGERHTA